MEKYRKVQKPKGEATVSEDEIRLTAQGSISAYVGRAGTVFNELEKPKITLKATGSALTKAVTAAEVIKRRFKGLHQITKLGTQEIVDEWEPIEEGLDNVVETRQMPFIEITLSKEELDTSDVGYQAPLDESMVKEVDAEELKRGRGRGKGRGKGKGRGEGKGKGKGSDKGKGKGKEKGKGKGKGKDEGKGKGKGKGKDEGKGKSKDKGKGKDEGKGKGKGKDAKGKSKGKGKDDSKGKGKGKKDYDSGYSKGWGKSYDRYDGGYKSYDKYDSGYKSYDKYDSGYKSYDRYDSGYGSSSKGKGKSKGKYSSSW